MVIIRYLCPNPKCKKQHSYKSQKRNAPRNADTKCKSCGERIYLHKRDIRVLNSKKKIPEISRKPLIKSDKYNKKSQIPNYLQSIHPVKKSFQIEKSSLDEKISTMEKVGINSKFTKDYSKKKDMFGLHRLRFKMKMKYCPPNIIWDKRRKMNGNWFKCWKYFQDHVMVKNKYSIEFMLSKSIYGHSVEQIFSYGEQIALNFFIYCEKEYGFEFTGELISFKQEHVVIPYNAVKDISRLGKHIILKDDKGDFMVDSSQDKDGDFEIKGVDKFRKLVKMAENYDKMSKNMEKLTEHIIQMGDKMSEKDKIIEKQREYIDLVIKETNINKDEETNKSKNNFKDGNIYI